MEKKLSFGKRVRYFLEYVPVCLLSTLFVLLPRRAALALGRNLGAAIGRVLGGRMHLARRNIQNSFGNISQTQTQSIIQGCWRNLGLSAAEVACTFSTSKEEFFKQVKVENWQAVAAAHAKGKGVLILTGHFGAWELCAQAFPFMGIAASLVARRIKNPYVNEYVNARREAYGNTVILARNAVRQTIDHLKRGKIVVLLIDHRVTQGDLKIPFLGRDAYTTSLPALLALRYGVPVCLTQTRRLQMEDPYRVEMTFSNELDLSDFRADTAGIVGATRLFNTIFEQWVERFPEQWLWIHNRWKQ